MSESNRVIPRLCKDKPSSCQLCFTDHIRGLTTEAKLQPDMAIVSEMIKHNVKVQEILDFFTTNQISKDSMNFLMWYEEYYNSTHKEGE